MSDARAGNGAPAGRGPRDRHAPADRPRTRPGSSSAARSPPTSSRAPTATRSPSATRSCTPTSTWRTTSEGDGVPIALKDVITTQGRPDDGRLADPRGLRPGLRLDRRRALQGRRPAAPRQDQPGRVRDGLLDARTRATGRRATPGIPSAFPAARRAARPPRSPAGSRPGRSAPTPAARSSSPAALCGLVGLRPTYGTVSRYGIVAFASSLDQVGPLTKTVRDCARLCSVIAGRDPRDSTTVELPEPVELPEARGPPGACGSASRAS